MAQRAIWPGPSHRSGCRGGACRPARRGGRDRGRPPAANTPRTGDRRSRRTRRLPSSGALVFHAGTVRDPKLATATPGGRVLAVVGPRGHDQLPAPPPGAATHGRRSDATSPGEIAALSTLRARPVAPRHPANGPPDWAGPLIRRYTAPGNGRDLDRCRLRADARVELAVGRAQAARGLVRQTQAVRAALEARAVVDVERIAEIERTTDHDVIAFVSQVAETVGPEGPLPAPRADQQRRRRHRPRPPAPGGRQPPDRRPRPLLATRNPRPSRRPAR